MVAVSLPGVVRCPLVVGRDAELAAISALLDAVGSGSGGALMLDADAGLGKSRLVAEAVVGARAAGIQVAAGRASASAAVPYRVLSEALVAMTGRQGPPDDRRIDPYRPVLGRLAPGWPSEAEPADMSAVALGEAVLAVAGVTAEPRGLLMVLEDLHWADGETLGVVEYVTDNLAGYPVGLLLTARPAPAAASRLGRELASRGAVARAVLAPLADSQAAEMAARCLAAVGRELAPDETAAVVARSAGLPLLIEDLLASLLARPANVVATAIPERFSDVVLQRLDALGSMAQRVVRAAAVFGPRFDWRLLGPVTALAEPGIGAAIREAIDAQLLVTDDQTGRPVFRHALTAEVIAADLDPSDRAALQLRAADAVASSGSGDPGELLALEARLRAAAGDSENAAALLIAVAERAAAAGALAAAEQHLRAAAELGTGNQRASAALLEVLVHRGRTEPALLLGRELLDSVRLVGEPRAAVELLMARACLTAGRLDEGQRHLTAARRTTSARQRAEIASVQARVTLAGIGPDRVVAAEHLAHQAVAEAEAAGAPELMCESLEVVGRCARLRDLDHARKAFERALAVADEHRLALWRIRALSELGTIEMFRDVEPAGLIEARRAAAAAGALATAAGVDVNLAAVHTMRAEFSLARAAAESCEALARRCGLPDVRAAGLVSQGVIAAHQGRFADMHAHVRAAEQLAGDDPDVIVGTWAMCRGTAALLREERDDARHAFATAASSLAGRPALAINPVDGPWLLLRVAAGEAGLGEVDDHATTHALGSRWSALWGGLSRAIALGELGEPDAATAAAENAVATAARMPLFLAIGLRLAAERAVATGWGRPQPWLTMAASTFAACGHARAAAACRDLLRSAGHRVPRPRAVDTVVPARLRDAGVTAREFEVLTLVARRCTNAEIAGRLYLSPRTVEKHVASLLAKTGAPSRTDLARLAADSDPAGEHGG